MKTIRSLQILFKNSTYKTISIHASCASYYMILSALPMLVVLFSLISALRIPKEYVWQMLEVCIPLSLLETIAPLLQHTDLMPSLPVLSVSALTWLWSASKGISAIIDGMDAALRLQTQQSYFRRRLSAILLLFLLSVGLVLTVIFQISGIRISRKIRYYLPVLPRFLLLLLKHRTFSSLLLLTVLFSIIYQFHPGTPLSFRYSLLGGMISALGWTAFSSAFSVYVHYFANRYHVFGELGSILLSAVWLRACMIMLLCGIKYADLRAAGNRSVSLYILRLLKNIHE